MLEGESFSWGDYRDPDQRAGVLSMLIAVHSAPYGASSGAPEDDYAIQMREELERALAEGIAVIEHGPYSVPFAHLLATHEPALRVALRKYDELVELARGESVRRVLTHGEPHPGNTMLTLDGWKLIDWDSAALAPPERDLWDLDPGDGSILAGYAKATGYTPHESLLELYSLRWDLADLALFAADFRRVHAQDANSAKSWSSTQNVVRGLVGPPRPL
jgi:spectinomycin phosphotransferase/16S rRNA (guanine(1405)-N(7))-methyltransferase